MMGTDSQVVAEPSNQHVCVPSYRPQSSRPVHPRSTPCSYLPTILSRMTFGLSSQNDNDRLDQSSNVLLNETTLLIFLERRQGGRRGPTEDEATRDQATPPNRTSLGGKDQPEASR